MMSDLGAGEHPAVVEFRRVRFNTVPMRVTEAERLNGVSARARVSMLAHAYRVDGGAWDDGPDLQPRNTMDVMSLALRNVIADAGQMGDGGAMVFDVVQFKGKWLASRSGSDLSGPLLSSRGYYSFDQLHGEAAPRFSCPQLSQKVQSTLAAEAAEAAKQKRHAAEEQAWLAAGPTHDPQRGIPYLLLSDADLNILERVSRGDFHADQNAIVDRYPIVPGPSQWLAVGTTFERYAGVDRFDPNRGNPRKTLMVVTLTSGPHAGAKALIETANYGPSDLSRPGRVARTRDEGLREEQAALINDRTADKVLVRDPVRGVPYLHVSDRDFAALASTFRTNWLGNSDTIPLQQQLGARFPATPSADQWLAPGTAISPISLTGRRGTGITWWMSKFGGKALALVRVESGPHSGETALIDMRNYASNFNTICPPAVPSLSCGAGR